MMQKTSWTYSSAFTLVQRSWRVFSLEVIDRHAGRVTLDIRGRHALRVFRCEGGTHRYQRVPPTERHGRVHTSTITVAIFAHSEKAEVKVRPQDLQWSYFRSNGPGGQHKNKTDSAVRLTHTPTGVVSIAQYGRSQSHNKQVALDALRAKLHRAQEEKIKAEKNAHRTTQVGRGARGEKVRTYCERKDLVVDHRNGKRLSLKKFLKGQTKRLRQRSQHGSYDF